MSTPRTYIPRDEADIREKVRCVIFNYYNLPSVLNLRLDATFPVDNVMQRNPNGLLTAKESHPARHVELGLSDVSGLASVHFDLLTGSSAPNHGPKTLWISIRGSLQDNGGQEIVSDGAVVSEIITVSWYDYRPSSWAQVVEILLKSLTRAFQDTGRPKPQYFQDQRLGEIEVCVG